MKKTNAIYWTFTGLMTIFMLMSSISDLMSATQTFEMVTKHLGYPGYIIPFIGVSKLLALIAILIPGFPKLKEWAYASFVFDLLLAVYSGLSVGDSIVKWLPVFLALVFIGGSYIFYHKKQYFKSQGGADNSVINIS